MECKLYYKPKDVRYYSLILFIVISSACSLTIQIIEFGGGISMLLNYVPWSLTIAYMFSYLNYINFRHLKPLLLLMIPFLQVLIASLFQFTYHNSIPRAIVIDTMIYIVGVALGEYIEEKHYQLILKVMVITTLVLGLYSYFVLLGGGGLYNSETGGYNKNAIGLIYASPIIIMLYNNNIFPKLKFAFVPFLVILVILSASRMSMLCCLLGIIIRIFIGSKTQKERIIYSAIIVAVLVVIFTNQKFYDRVVVEIFLKGNESLNADNANQISSGRTGLYGWFSTLIKTTWFAGGAGYNFENFYLDTLCKMGIIGAVPIFIFILLPLYYCVKDYKNKNHCELRKMLLAIIILMLINGIGEEMTPLGPGVKCFVVWLTFGYYMGQRGKEQEIAYYKYKEKM